MSKRLNIERQKELEPQRMEFACKEIAKLGIQYIADEKKICFKWNGSQVTLFPYSGWHSGATIKDGRGLQKLLTQLKKTNEQYHYNR